MSSLIKIKYILSEFTALLCTLYLTRKIHFVIVVLWGSFPLDDEWKSISLLLWRLVCHRWRAYSLSDNQLIMRFDNSGFTLNTFIMLSNMLLFRIENLIKLTLIEFYAGSREKWGFWCIFYRLSRLQQYY